MTPAVDQQVLLNCKLLIEVYGLGNKPVLFLCSACLGGYVKIVDKTGTGGGPCKSCKNTDGGGLSRPIGSEVGKHLTRFYLDVNAIKGSDILILFHELFNLYHMCHIFRMCHVFL